MITREPSEYTATAQWFVNKYGKNAVNKFVENTPPIIGFDQENRLEERGRIIREIKRILETNH